VTITPTAPAAAPTATAPTAPAAPRLTLVIGGARSGKSAVAERLVERHEGPLLYLATGSILDSAGRLDPDMAARVDMHQQRRGERYRTIESGPDLVGALTDAPAWPALVDGLGTWVAAHWDSDAPDGGFAADPHELVAAFRRHPKPIVVVTDEVGLGVHPETAVGRRFRDALGTANQAVAHYADLALLVVAGRALELHPADRW